MPRFPFRRSVADDLRDLWAIDRIDRQARSLGYSSLSPGDGSLDLINASGTTIARYGDLPGGGFGVGVPDGAGGWRTVQADAQARVDTLGTAVNSRLDGHASRLGSVEGRVSTAEGRLDSHASRLGAAEGRLTTAEGTLSGVRSEVTTARGGFADLNARLADHVSRIGAAESRLDTIESIQRTLGAQIDLLNRKVDHLVDQGGSPRPPWW